LVKQINHAVKRPATDPLCNGHAPDSAITNEPLNLRYGFFAVMGGFRANVAAFGKEFTSLPLTPDFLRYLAERGHFVRIEKGTIADCSKADGFAKMIICFQVTWLFAECVVRKTKGLPLTLLEIHTWVHVVCSLMLYGLWFKVRQALNDHCNW
jgi:hypothetical protein